MKLTSTQLQKIVEKVFTAWEKQNVVTYKVDKSKAMARALAALVADYQKEIDLDHEVKNMLDHLERTNSGEFQRHKMYTMLKQKLAKEKKVIL